MLRRGFGPSLLDAETRVWSLASWPILALRLELRILLFNGLSFSDFLDSLQNPLQSFRYSAVNWDGFRNTLDPGSAHPYDRTVKIPGLIFSGIRSS